MLDEMKKHKGLIFLRNLINIFTHEQTAICWYDLLSNSKLVWCKVVYFERLAFLVFFNRYLEINYKFLKQLL